MNKISLPIITLAMVCTLQSCYKDGPDHKWNRGTDPTGNKTIIIDPIGIDIDGDGIADKFIEMTDDVGSETYPDGSPVNKECFNNSPTKCLEGGGLYPPEAASNKTFETLFEESKKALDKDGDGKMDVGSAIAETIIPSISTSLSAKTADSTVKKLLANSDVTNVTLTVVSKTAQQVLKTDSLAKYDIEALNIAIQEATMNIFITGNSSDIYSEIASAVKTATDKAVQEQIAANPAFIDEDQMTAAVQDAITSATQDIVQEYIQKAVQDAIIKSLTETSNSTLNSSQIAVIASVVAKESSQNIASDLIASIAAEQASEIQTAISQTIYSQPQYETTPVQGLCQDGYHVPSDREWKEIELALGMPASDVHLSGIYADRGKSVDMAKKFETALNLQYGGYGTSDGRFAQYDEVSVFATSTIGKDAEGEYVWVRYIDNLGDHKGVIRKKLRKGTLMSVRCVK